MCVDSSLQVLVVIHLCSSLADVHLKANCVNVF